MMSSQQQVLFGELETTLLADAGSQQEWGTFKDSLRAPIHNWFTYPAGFSYKAVEFSLKQGGIGAGDFVYDPFMGTGTTNLTAKCLGVNSYGVEAHPFVFRVARTKLNWEIDEKQVVKALQDIHDFVQRQRAELSDQINAVIEAAFPELVLKCYSAEVLFDLFLLREAIRTANVAVELADFLFVGLTSLLRQVSAVATGWPYIAPNKPKNSGQQKDALAEFSAQVARMLRDLQTTVKQARRDALDSQHLIFNADCRDTAQLIPAESAAQVFTSPPYLNNYDYADRTRLELYFFGEAKTWGDITKLVRDRLITSATTQINRDDPRYQLTQQLKEAAPDIYTFLQEAVAQLGALRLTKGGKKSYDHLVSGYFNDLFLVLKDAYRVLQKGRKAVFVLGDSAPYGVYIPTDELIGKLGLAIGFSGYEVEVLRTRGGKWKDNPQRHDVQLRESIVTLTK
jgi:DNA modification methylase